MIRYNKVKYIRAYQNFWTLDASVGRWALDVHSERWTLDAILWTLDSGSWMLHFGLWALDTGYCHCLFQNRIRTQFLILLD